MAETRWLDDDEQEAWRAFLKATQLLDSALDRQLRHASGLSHANYQILAMLSEAPGRELTMTQLARLLRSSQSRLSHAAARLEADGKIRRYKRPDNRRTTIVEILPAGVKALEAAAPGHVLEVRRVLFDTLSREQIGQLREISESMLSVLDPLGEEPRYSDSSGIQSQD
ncbi:MarR family winged helix-turn-helix transcriptional regulator [Nocardiopsis oceani]